MYTHTHTLLFHPKGDSKKNELLIKRHHFFLQNP